MLLGALVFGIGTEGVQCCRVDAVEAGILLDAAKVGSYLGEKFPDYTRPQPMHPLDGTPEPQIIGGGRRRLPDLSVWVLMPSA